MWFLRVMPSLSYFRYALEALYVAEARTWLVIGFEIQGLSLADYLRSVSAA